MSDHTSRRSVRTFFSRSLTSFGNRPARNLRAPSPGFPVSLRTRSRLRNGGNRAQPEDFVLHLPDYNSHLDCREDPAETTFSLQSMCSLSVGKGCVMLPGADQPTRKRLGCLGPCKACVCYTDPCRHTVAQYMRQLAPGFMGVEPARPPLAVTFPNPRAHVPRGLKASGRNASFLPRRTISSTDLPRILQAWHPDQYD